MVYAGQTQYRAWKMLCSFQIKDNLQQFNFKQQSIKIDDPRELQNRIFNIASTNMYLIRVVAGILYSNTMTQCKIFRYL